MFAWMTKIITKGALVMPETLVRKELLTPEMAAYQRNLYLHSVEIDQ